MRPLLTIAGILLIFSACSHKDDEPIRKFTSFIVDGEIVVAENPVAVLTPANLSDDVATNDYPVLTITAIGNHGETIKFTLLSESENIRAGSYSTDIQGNSIRVGYDGLPYNLQASYEYGYMSMNVYKVEDTLIEASFSGTLEDSTNTISSRILDNGFIRAVFKRDTI